MGFNYYIGGLMMIIAHRRRDQDYWEGYTECDEAVVKERADYFSSLGQIVKVFPSMAKYHDDCNKLLDIWRTIRTRQRGDEVTF